MKKLLTTIVLLLGLQFTFAQDANTIEENTIQNTKTIKVKVFPNPATNVINVLGLRNSPRADIAITDTYGNKVSHYRWAIKNNALNIPITGLESGIYIITIRSSEQNVQTKFYKQ